MPDLCNANNELLGPGGSDRGLLTDDEKARGDATRLSHTESDKRILRQYEGAAEPGKKLCMVLQEKKHVWTYVLFHVRLTIQDASANSFAIYQDALQTTR